MLHMSPRWTDLSPHVHCTAAASVAHLRRHLFLQDTQSTNTLDSELQKRSRQNLKHQQMHRYLKHLSFVVAEGSDSAETSKA